MPPRSEETKAKISATMRGRPKSIAHRQAISEGHAAYKDSGAFYWSDEYREKMSKAKMGQKHTEATKRICRAAGLKAAFGNAINPLNEHQVPTANDRPDWLKPFI